MSGAKKGRTEAQRIAAAIKSYKVEYYVSDCETEDDYKVCSHGSALLRRI